jgi:hypothetical protein
MNVVLSMFDHMQQALDNKKKPNEAQVRLMVQTYQGLLEVLPDVLIGAEAHERKRT